MDATRLVERYLDTWNETNADARRAAVEEIWADEGRYVDPMVDVSGSEKISEAIGAAQAQVPGHVVRLLDDRNRIDAHHNVVRFYWELVPAAGGESLAIGFDVAVTDERGQIASVLGFLDKAPQA